MNPSNGYEYITPPVSTSKPKRNKMLVVILIIATVLSVGLASWSMVRYISQRRDFNSQIDTAVVDAKKEQADLDEEKFAAREKEPNREFSGPEDYGSLTFSYPKTWSVYIGDEASDGGDYEAYLNPVIVPTISKDQRFALRVLIENESYEKVISSYSKKVSSGELISQSISVGDINGTRLDGQFSDDIRGAAVIFKIRDKTLTIKTDAQTFMDDFEAIIQTIEFIE